MKDMRTDVNVRLLSNGTKTIQELDLVLKCNRNKILNPSNRDFCWNTRREWSSTKQNNCNNPGFQKALVGKKKTRKCRRRCRNPLHPNTTKDASLRSTQTGKQIGSKAPILILHALVKY